MQLLRGFVIFRFINPGAAFPHLVVVAVTTIRAPITDLPIIVATPAMPTPITAVAASSSFSFWLSWRPLPLPPPPLGLRLQLENPRLTFTVSQIAIPAFFVDLAGPVYVVPSSLPFH